MKAQASPLRAICCGPMSLRSARPTDRRAWSAVLWWRRDIRCSYFWSRPFLRLSGNWRAWVA